MMISKNISCKYLRDLELNILINKLVSCKLCKALENVVFMYILKL